MSRKKKKSSPSDHRERFEAQAAEQDPGLVVEFWQFVRTNKKWWMIPIVAVLLVLAGLIFLGGTALAPFVYTLF
jgi:hypothetical protein